MPNVLGKILYNSEYILTSTTEAQPQRNTKIYVENLFSLKRKITGQTPNNFTILNRDYNIQRYNLSTKKKNPHFFFSLTVLFFTMYLSQISHALSMFLFSYAYSHLRSSSRLHQSSHLGTSLHSSTPSSQMTSFIYYSAFILNL